MFNRRPETDNSSVDKLLNELDHQHAHFSKRFFEDPILCPHAYQDQVKRIEKEWAERPTLSSFRTEETDKKDLYRAFEFLQLEENVCKVKINQLFGKLYEAFQNLKLDNELGRLSDELFTKYLYAYHDCIEANKKLRLDHWNKLIAEEIVKYVKIASNTVIQ